MNTLLVIGSGTDSFPDIEATLRSHYRFIMSDSVRKGVEIMRTHQITAILLEHGLPDVSCHEIVRLIHHEVDPHIPIIVIAGHADVDCAVAAMREGAYDFIDKDIDPDHLSLKILKALERRDLEVRLTVLEHGQAQQHGSFIFASDAMKRVNLEISRLASLDFDVLLVGETGVGKDMVAWQLHKRGLRWKRPFVPVVMRTFSETLIESELFGHEKGAFSGAERAKIGKFEAANGGTIYIPEVSCLDENTQLKLQHFMQYKCISRVGQDPRRTDIQLDVRLILATNDNLQQLVHSGRLREDFYHRIAGVRLEIPPLRERVQDIEVLADYFLEMYSGGKRGEKFDFTKEAVSALKQYQWPGNVRELENAIKNALSYADEPLLQLHHFPMLTHPPGYTCALLSADPDDVPSYEEAELLFRRDYFRRLWELTGRNVARMASLARMTPQGIRKVLHTLHLQ